MKTIADLIAQIAPPQCYGDELVIAQLKSYAVTIAELERHTATTASAHMRDFYEQQIAEHQRLAETIAHIALAYRR